MVSDTYQWQIQISSEPLCEDITDPTECTDANCHWYPYPNPFGEPTCHTQDMMTQYLPIIGLGLGIAGIGLLIFKIKRKNKSVNKGGRK